MAEPQPPPSREPPQSTRSGSLSAPQGWTLVVSNLTKLVGVGIAINEAVLRSDARNSVILMCVIFVLGVQAGEGVLLRIIDRLFDGSTR